jgi:hypothetical protein
MRIIATSDLHYNIARGRSSTEAMAREICRLGGDLLLFVGDTASTDLNVLRECFALFDGFSGHRLAVAGNHELWTVGGACSLNRYNDEMQAACRASGVHYLDAGPWYADGVAVVGSVGWYDYSFRPADLGVPLRFYQHKIGPGVAAREDDLRHLLEPQDDIGPAAMDITTRWMDGVRVRLPVCDVDFAHETAGRLRSHLEMVHDKARSVVAAVHHLPFAELVPAGNNPRWAFANAFMGSELLGETLLDFSKVTHAFCGHSHQYRSCRKRGLACTSIGSTYTEKRYEVLELR